MFIFSVKDHYYAFEVDKVREVTGRRKIAPVPKALSYIKGVINFKGALFCILDSFLFFDLIDERADSHDIIILSDDDYNVGFIAEKIIGVVDTSDLTRDEALTHKDYYIKGSYWYEGKEVRLIDSRKIFSLIEEEIYNGNMKI